MSIIKLSNVSKFYQNKNNISTGFSKINLELNIGEFVAITGESGSGKSTLLNVISGLDSYEEGEMYINGEETSHYNEVDYENYRRKYIGNIFQNFNLVNSYTVYQNIELVLLLNGYKKRDAKKKTLDIIETVGLTKYKRVKASKLSGGQKQRVAIARALASDAPIILADEPTGNLDIKSASSIMKLLKDISCDKLVLVVTHNYEQVSKYATRKISMNDGKIIEDVSIRPYDEVEAKTVEYKNMTNTNKLLLGFRNAFNIKGKFILLFLVYFFLTFLVFSEYSSLAKQNEEESYQGYNYLFSDTSPERVILKKTDKSAFNEDDIKVLESMDGILRVEKNDLLLDLEGIVYNDDVYFTGKIKSIDALDTVDVGSLPTSDDEIVLEGYEYSYYFDEFKDNLIGSTVNIQNNRNGASLGSSKITGLKYNNNEEFIYGDEDTIIYVSNNILEKLNLRLSESYSNIELTIGDKTYIQDDYSLYYVVVPNSNVESGTAYVFNDLNMVCPNYNCLNKKLNISVSNLYFEDSKDLVIKKIITESNLKSTLGLQGWSEYSNTIFLNEDDYNNLFYKGDYQVSVYLEDLKTSSEVISKLNNLGYDTYFMKDNLVNEMAELLGVLNLFSAIIFIIATVTLFFVSYFIIKIVLKSRNVYFSTIRILGSTKQIAKQLLNIELLIDINIAYLVFLVLSLLATSGIITSTYIADLMTYFTFKDYVLIYIILIVMSLLISNRYSRKLFKDSVMKTYREDV